MLALCSVTHRMAFGEAQRAFELIATKAEGCVKVVLYPDGKEGIGAALPGSGANGGGGGGDGGGAPPPANLAASLD